MLEKARTNYVLDADMQSFFSHLNHEWIIKFVESKMKDSNIIRLIRRMLKAGIMEDFQYIPTEKGSGQGSVCSPVTANLYMHYVLIWWFHEQIRPRMKKYCGLVVYADDFVACFQYKREAEYFYGHLKKRMEHFGLSLEEEKSRLIEFGRYAQENVEKLWKESGHIRFSGIYTLLFQSRNGRFRVKKTSKKKFAKKCKEMYRLIQEIRN